MGCPPFTPIIKVCPPVHPLSAGFGADVIGFSLVGCRICLALVPVPSLFLSALFSFSSFVLSLGLKIALPPVPGQPPPL